MGHRKGDPRPDQQIDAPPGENARRVRIGMELMKQPRVNMQNPDDVIDRCAWYLEKCAEWDDRPTVAGFALAMGYSRDQLLTIKNGLVKSVPAESVDTLKRAWDLINQTMEQYMVDGHLNPVTAIFLLKNNFGYKDQTESVIVRKDPYETGDPEEIARRRLAGMAPALDVPRDSALDVPIVETRIVDQDGKVE